MFSVRYAGARKRSATRSTHDDSLEENTLRNSTPSSPVQRPYFPGHNASFHSLHTVLSHPVDLTMTSINSSPSSPSMSTSLGTGIRLPSSQPCSPLVSPLTDARYRVEHGARPAYSQSSNCQSPLSPSQSSYPSTPRSRSTTDSDIQFPLHTPSRHVGRSRPSTAPHPRSHPFGAGDTGLSQRQMQGNLYDISRLTMGIKTLLSKPAQPSPSRYSLYSTPSDSEAPSPVQCVPRKSRPPDLDVAACPSSPPQTSALTDVYYRPSSEAVKGSGPLSSFSPLTRLQSRDSPECKVTSAVRGRDDKPRNVLRRRPSGSAKSLKDKYDEVTSATPKGRSSFDAHDIPPLPSPPQTKHENTNRLGNGSVWQTPPRLVVQIHTQGEVFDSGSRHGSPLLSRSESRNQYEQHARAHTSLPMRDDIASRSPTPYHLTFAASTAQSTTGDGRSDPWTAQKCDVLADSPASDTRPGGHRRSLSRKLSARWKKVTGGIVTSENLSHSSPKIGHTKGRPSLQEWSRGRSKERGRFTGQSMDGMGELSTREEVWASQAIGRERSHTDPSADKADVKDSGGGKVWKLVKHISTGSLRDRFHDKAVPPVPAIPKELLDQAKYTDRPSQAADIAARPWPPSRKRSSSLEKQHKARPSVTTTSSSPYSSDVASAQFFQRPYSPRSSISSYGEPKLPGLHIIPPLEQLRLGDDICSGGDETPRSPRRRSASLPPGVRNTPDLDLPLRSPSSGGSNGESSTTLSGHTILAEGGVALSPPPRHSRGKLRTSNGSVPGFPSQSALKPEGDCDSNVRNHARATTPQRGSLEQYHVRTQITFRQLDARRRPPLTEREKTDIWDTLLARSDKAGGTLHISTGELMSDNLRLSTHSELS